MKFITNQIIKLGETLMLYSFIDWVALIFIIQFFSLFSCLFIGIWINPIAFENCDRLFFSCALTFILHSIITKTKNDEKEKD